MSFTQSLKVPRHLRTVHHLSEEEIKEHVPTRRDLLRNRVWCPVYGCTLDSTPNSLSLNTRTLVAHLRNVHGLNKEEVKRLVPHVKDHDLAGFARFSSNYRMSGST